MKLTDIEKEIINLLKTSAKVETTKNGCRKCAIRHICTFYLPECPLYWDFDGEIEKE